MTSTREPSHLRAALSRYAHARAASFADARRRLGIGEGDAKALVYIAEKPGVRAADIAGHLGITPAGATALIDRLVERGVATRQFDATDRRVIRILPAVSLQEEPWSALCQFDDEFDRIVRSHDDARVREFADLLGELTEAVSEG